MNEVNLSILWKKIVTKINEGKIKPLPGVNSFEDFKSKLSDKNNRRIFWDSKSQIYRSHGITEMKKSFNEFDNWIISEPPVPSPTTDEDGITWNEVLESTWDALKRAGYWVKKEGGKLLAAIKDGKNVKKEEIENIFKCINAYNKWWGYYKLSEGWDGVNKYAYEHTTHKVNGREVKLLYMDDGRVVMRFEDNDSDVPGGSGKWECDSEGTGYRIKWSNGQVAVFSKRKEISKNSSTENSSNTDNSTTEQGQGSAMPKFKEVCKSTTSCPNRKDVEKGISFYKICMRCPDIQEFQNNPVFKVIYFKKLKENGYQEKADGVFGPITESAVEEYQEMNGLRKDGIIGDKTLAQLDKDKLGRK